MPRSGDEERGKCPAPGIVAINASNKSNEIHKRAMSLAQTAVSMFLTDRQKRKTKSKVIKSSRDMPQQLAAGLALRQSIRSKEIVNMLHGFGMSVEYNRLLRIEAQIEQNVLERMNQHGGMYLPENFVKNRHVFFAIDNVDFAEDNEKNTHFTAPQWLSTRRRILETQLHR